MGSVLNYSASYSKRSQFSDISKESKQKVYWKEEMAISLLKNVRAWRSIAFKSIFRGELKEYEQHRKLYFEHYLFQSMITKIHDNENLFFFVCHCAFEQHHGQFCPTTEFSKSLLKLIKPNYFKKQCSSSSFLLTKGNNTSLKWQWSTRQGSSMS